MPGVGFDVSPEDSVYFQPIQRVGLQGLLKGTGVPYKWANQTWFYPDSLLLTEHIPQPLYDALKKVPYH